MFVAGVLGSGFSDRLSANDATPTIKIGSMLVTGFRGQSDKDPEVQAVVELLGRGEIAGVLLLERNIRSPEQLFALTDLFRVAADFVPIIAIDQEGGKVTRVGERNGFLEWQSASEIAQSRMSDEDIQEYYFLRAAQLASVGVNVNLAPVVDLNVNPDNPIIGRLGRSFGREANEVVRLSSLFIGAHRRASVRTCLKHFPGHGSSVSDSHLGLVDVSATWSVEELVPFSIMVERNLVDAVMTAHVLVEQLSESQSVPFTLSSHLGEALRQGIGFDGAVFSDDMQMGAIVAGFGTNDAARMAINAGNTFLIYSNYRPEHDLNAIRAIRASLEIDYSNGALDMDVVASSQVAAKAFLEGLS